jgi:hypothetical protein
VSPFPTVAPSDRGSPPTNGTMRTLRRLSSRFSLLRLSLVSRYLAVSLFSVLWAVSGTRHRTQPGEFGHPALPHDLTGHLQQGVDRPPRFLNQPCVHMPRSKTPAGLKPPPSLSRLRCCLPHKCKASASHDYTTFQDSMTQPAYLLLLCFTVLLTASRAEFATGLLTGFGRVGLSPTG